MKSRYTVDALRCHNKRWVWGRGGGEVRTRNFQSSKTFPLIVTMKKNILQLDLRAICVLQQLITLADLSHGII